MLNNGIIVHSTKSSGRRTSNCHALPPHELRAGRTTAAKCIHRRASRRRVVIENAEQRVRRPVRRVILAMARDQRFVGAAEVEFETAPDSVKTVLARNPLDERGAHDAVTEREGNLAAEG